MQVVGPGLQESRTTSAVVRVYPQQGSRTRAPGTPSTLEFVGTSNTKGGPAAVTAVTCGKSLGGAEGNFTVTVKAPDDMGRERPSLKDQLEDDDWIDIGFNVNGKVDHVMRGQIDTIAENVQAQGGATSRTYTLTGRDHGRVFTVNPLWFNRFRAENVADQETLRALQTGGEPHQTVERILFNFLTILADSGRLPIAVPPALRAGETLLDSLAFFSGQFERDPVRRSIVLQMESNGGSIWRFAQEWSDPMFCELFCDLRPRQGTEFLPGQNYGFDDTLLGVVFRTKPFPTTARGRDSRWFKLPVLDLPQQWVTDRRVGKGGLERYNAFFVSASTLQETADLDMHGPLWDLDDIKRHGLRKFDVESRYVTAQNDLFTLNRQQRASARDWHCLNARLLSGSIECGALVPQARIASRLRLLRDREVDQENYYIEQVGHTWTLQAGGRTSLGVTRGWVGDDASYLAALQDASSRYTTLVSTP